LAEKVFDRLKSYKLTAKTITLKVKYANFQQVTRSQTSTEVLSDLASMQAMLPDLLSRTNAGQQAVRLVGVTASGFIHAEEEHDQQLDFYLE